MLNDDVRNDWIARDYFTREDDVPRSAKL